MYTNASNQPGRNYGNRYPGSVGGPIQTTDGVSHMNDNINGTTKPPNSNYPSDVGTMGANQAHPNTGVPGNVDYNKHQRSNPLQTNGTNIVYHSPPSQPSHLNVSPNQHRRYGSIGGTSSKGSDSNGPTMGTSTSNHTPRTNPAPPNHSAMNTSTTSTVTSNVPPPVMYDPNQLVVIDCYLTTHNHLTDANLVCLRICPCGKANQSSISSAPVPVQYLPQHLHPDLHIQRKHHILIQVQVPASLIHPPPPPAQPVPVPVPQQQPQQTVQHHQPQQQQQTVQQQSSHTSTASHQQQQQQTQQQQTQHNPHAHLPDPNSKSSKHHRSRMPPTPSNGSSQQGFSGGVQHVNGYALQQPVGYTHEFPPSNPMEDQIYASIMSDIYDNGSGDTQSQGMNDHSVDQSSNAGSSKHKASKSSSGALSQLTTALERLDIQPNATVASIFDDGYDSDEETVLVANRLQQQISKKSLLHINPPADPNFRPDYVVGHFLQQISLTANLTPEECAIMGGCMRLHRYAPGDVIIRQGDAGRGFYILKVGCAQVTMYEGDVTHSKIIDYIYSGEFFGESILFSNAPRTASVIALRPCEVLFMHKDDFHILFDNAKVPNAIVFTRRSRNTNYIPPSESTFMSLYELKPPKHKFLAREPQVVDMLVKSLCKQTVFQGMEHEHRLNLINHMWFASVPRGTILIRQNDVGDNLYVLIHGKVNVYIRSEDGKEQKKVDSFDTPGRCFGELALVYNTPRNATVVTKTDASLWVLDRITYRRILRNVTPHSIQKHRMLLSRIPFFDNAKEQELNQVAETLELLSFKDGDLITKQYDKADGVFFIVSGLVHIIKRLEDGSAFIVNQLLDGDMFGERAICENQPRSASAMAIGPVEVAKIDRYVFSNVLLPSFHQYFAARCRIYAFRDQLVHEQQRDLLTVSAEMVESQRKKVEILANQHSVYKLDKLTRLGFLGKGGYGYVELVHNKETDETFALKSLYRSHIMRTKSTTNVINEKRLLSKLRSPHIIRLYATFKDAECLYFLLEPCLGGELFTLLRVRNTFEDKCARFFAASVLCAIEEMHRQGVAYRDLKPENLLLDANGYIKVTDFGLSKEIHDSRTYTVCGTPHYLAPEIVKGLGHTKAVDLWCYGVLIYEMLAGRPPFYKSGERGDHVKLYKRIVACDYHASSLFTPEAWDLIQRLLQPHEQHRIGYGGVEAFRDIKAHPWFLGLDWEGLSQRTLRAPIIPYLKTPEDTHNFKKANPNYVQPGKDTPAEGDMSWDAEF